MSRSFSQVAIIGGGPAGISCAVQLKRFGIDCMLFEKNRIGGMLWNAGRIDNYSGFPYGISGEEVCSKLKQHADRFEIQIVPKEVQKINFSQDQFHLFGEGHEHLSDRLVIASGTKARPLHNISISKDAQVLIYRDVYPLKKTTAREIGIVGAGDAAFDYAISLANENKITIYNRGDRLKAIGNLAEQVKKHHNIRYHENIQLKEVLTADHKLLVKTSRGNFSNDFLIFAIGREPALDFLSEHIAGKMDELTAAGKIFLAGDVVNESKRQLAIAAGDGLKVAMKIKELEG